MRHFEFRVDSVRRGRRVRSTDPPTAGSTTDPGPTDVSTSLVGPTVSRPGATENSWAACTASDRGLFAAESKFHRRTDASKAAVVALATGLVDDHPRLIDVQWRTDHLATLGVTEIPRARYLERLRAVLPSPEPRMFRDTSRTISHPLT